VSLKLEQMYGDDTFGELVKWTWNREKMRYEAEYRDHYLALHFTKVGGRWSKGSDKSYWTTEVDYDRASVSKFPTAELAKEYALERFRHRFHKCRFCGELFTCGSTLVDRQLFDRHLCSNGECVAARNAE